MQVCASEPDQHSAHCCWLLLRRPSLNVTQFEGPLLAAAKEQNEAKVQQQLETIYQSVPQQDWDAAAALYAAQVSDTHYGVPDQPLPGPLDDDKFSMRYLAYTVRVVQPLAVFSSVVTTFLATQRSNLLNGVQLVGPENNPTALRDYWLHMQMVRGFA